MKIGIAVNTDYILYYVVTMYGFVSSYYVWTCAIRRMALWLGLCQSKEGPASLQVCWLEFNFKVFCNTAVLQKT